MKKNFSDFLTINRTLVHGRLRLWGLVAAWVVGSWHTSSAQVSITTGNHQQTFDAIGATATATLPTGFKFGSNTVDWTAAGNTTATTLAAGSSGTGVLTSSSGGGAYNFANGVTGTSTERAIGYLTSGSYASPRDIFFAFTNNTGATVSELYINFDYEKYRSGSTTTSWTFFHGSTSTSVNTAATAGDQTYTADADNTVVSNPPALINKGVLLTGLTIANGATYYLRWRYTVSGSTNAQAIGIDNLNITLATAYYWNGGNTAANPANGGDGTWGTTNAWRQSTVTGTQATFANSTIAIFGGTAGIVTVDANRDPHSNIFNTSGYTLASSAAVTLSGLVNVGSGIGLTLSPSANTLTMSGAVVGAGFLTKTGAGALTLSGASTFSGGVTLGAGTLNVGNAAALGTGTFTVSGGTFNTSGGTITLSTNNAQTWNSNINFTGTNSLNLGTGAVTLTADNTVTVTANTLTVSGVISGAFGLTKSGSGILTLGGVNTYTGKTIINAGVISLISENRLGTAPASFVADQITLNGGTITYTGTTGANINSNRGITLGASGGTFNITNSSGTVTLTTVTTGSGALTKTGATTLVMTGAHTYTGLTTVSAGTLQLNRTVGTTIPTTNNVTVSGGTLQVSKDQTLNNLTIASGATLTVDAGVTLTINGTLQTAGTITNSGTIAYGSSSTLIYAGTTQQTATALEFPSTSGPANLTINNSAGFRLPFSRTLTGNWIVTSGDVQNASGAGITMTMSGSAAVLTVNGSITGTNVGAGNDINLTYSGSGTLSLSGSGSLCRFLNVTISNTAANLTLSRALEVMFGTFTMNGTLQMNSGGVVSSVAPTYGSSSNLVYNSTYGVSNEWTGNSTTAGSGVPQNVTIQNAATVTMPASNRGMAGNLNISSGALALNGTSGDLYIAGNWTKAASQTFTPNGRAVFFNGTTTQVVTAGSGTETFNYLLVQGSGTLQLATGTNVVVNSSGGLTLGSSHATSTINLNGQTLTLSGGGNMSLSSGNRFITSSTAGGTFFISGSTTTVTSGGTLTLGSNVTTALSAGMDFGSNLTTINNVLQINSGGFVGTNAPIYGNASKLIYNFNGTFGRGNEWNATGVGTIGTTAGYPNDVQVSNNTTLNFPNGSNTVRACARDLTIDAGSNLYADFSSGSVNLTVGRNISIAGGISLGGSSGGDLTVGGNFTRTGTFTPNGRAVFFNAASGDQTITGATTFPFVIVDKTAGNVVLANDITCTGTLTLTNGKISTGSNKVIISSSGSISRTNGWVIGFLQKNAATGATSRTFEIGDATNYTPLSISFGNVTAAGDLTANVTASAHPNRGTSTLSATKYVARYWTVTNSGTTFDNYAATFTYVSGDIQGSASTSALLVGKYDASTWTYPTVASTTSTSVTTSSTMTAFSDFFLGEQGCINPTAFNVTGSGAYCSGGTGVAIGLSNSETGVDYQLILSAANDGSPVSGTSSAISFGLRTAAGTYTVLGTRTLGGCSTTMTGNAVVTVNSRPTVAISNKVADACMLGVGAVTITGSGGTGTLSITWTAAANGSRPSGATGSATGSPAGTAQTSPVTYTGLTGWYDYNFLVTDSNGCTAPSIGNQ